MSESDIIKLFNQTCAFFRHDDVMKWKCFLYYWPLVRRLNSQRDRNMDLWYFLCSQHGKAFEKQSKTKKQEKYPKNKNSWVAVLWDAIALMWCHCNEAIEDNLRHLMLSRITVSNSIELQWPFTEEQLMTKGNITHPYRLFRPTTVIAWLK